MEFVMKRMEQIETLAAEVREYVAKKKENEESSKVNEVEDGNFLTIENAEGNEETINLDTLTVKELKKLALDLDVEVTKKGKEDIITEIMSAFTDNEEETEETVEFGEEEESAGEEEEVDIAEEYGLNDMSDEELKEMLEENGLSTKGKRQSWIARIVDGIEDGTIETETEEESEDEGESFDIDDQVEEDTEEEKAIEAEIRQEVKSGKLKVSAVKKFLENRNTSSGDPDCQDCSKCSKEDLLNCYILVHKKLVDDDGERHDFEECYMRNDEAWCCGEPLKAVKTKGKTTYTCEFCGAEYEE